jgi:hypothetical protein
MSFQPRFSILANCGAAETSSKRVVGAFNDLDLDLTFTTCQFQDVLEVIKLPYTGLSARCFPPGSLDEENGQARGCEFLPAAEQR